MANYREDIARNLASVYDGMKRAAERAGRRAEGIRLVAITKSVGIEEARILRSLDVIHFGENRPELAAGKIMDLKDGARWHMVGPVQRRKARDIAGLFDYVDSIDRLDAAEALDRHCDELKKVMPVLLEINVSGEATKHGFSPEEVEPALEAIGELRHLRVEGLMTMAPFVDDPEKVRPVFANLRQLAERFHLTELSMGMSNDFEVAIEEGATQIRIGTALF